MPADGFNGKYLSRLEHLIHEAFDVLRKIVRRNEIFGALTGCFLCRVPKDRREFRVDTRNPEVAIDHDNSLGNSREQFAEICPLFLEGVAQADERLQVPLQDIAAMQQELLVEVTVSIRPIIK